MSTIKIKCIEHMITVVNTPNITSGNVNNDYAEFEFCQTWSGFAKTAIFYRDEKEVYYQVLDTNNKCIIPKEVLVAEGSIYIGVFGVKDDVTLTTEVLKYRISRGALTENLQPSDPTPDIYEQLLSEMADIKAIGETLSGSVAAIEKNTTDIQTLNSQVDLLDIQTSTDKVLKNTAAGGLKINSIYGKNIQEGTPDAPIEIKSVGYENLLENTLTSQTINGVSFVVNEDKSITANGVATQQIYCNINTFIELDNKQYILSGCAKGGSTSTYRISLYNYDGSWLNVDIGTGISFTPKKSDNIGVRVELTISQGTTLNNVTFYPMIRKADVIAAEYVPYGKTRIDVKVNSENLVQFKDKTFAANGVTVDIKDSVAIATGTPTITSGVITTLFSEYVDLSLLTDGVTYYAYKGCALAITYKDGTTGYVANITYNSETMSAIRAYIQYNVSSYNNGMTTYLMLSDNSNAIFSPYQTSSASIITENGLNEINGVRDEIDLNRGVYIQRIGKQVYSNVEWTIQTEGYISTLRLNIPANMKNAIEGKGSQFMSNIGNVIWTGNSYINFETTLTLEEFIQAINGVDVVVYYPLTTPIETPLSSEELIAINSLKTYNTTTLISINSLVEPDIEVEYGTSKGGGYTLESLLLAKSNSVQLAEMQEALLSTGANV